MSPTVTLVFTIIALVLTLIGVVLSAIGLREFKFVKLAFVGSAITLTVASAFYEIGLSLPDWARALAIIVSTIVISFLCLLLLYWLDRKRTDIENNWKGAQPSGASASSPGASTTTPRPVPKSPLYPSALDTAVAEMFKREEKSESNVCDFQSSKTLADIAQYFKDNTTDKAKLLAEPFMNIEWRLKGIVNNLDSHQPAYITFNVGSFGLVSTIAFFESGSEERLRKIDRGEQVTLKGTLTEIRHDSATLMNCRLV